MSTNKRNRIFLTRILGATAGLIQGDTAVLDRWLWLKQRLPETNNGERLLDVGCGTGAFTICAAKRGYHATGLTWNESDQQTAKMRTQIIRESRARFEVCDVRELDQRLDFLNSFDVAICCENIEHILDDKRLIRAIYGTLKPGGRFLLTTPNYYFRYVTRSDMGPYSTIEDGGHVRRGYTRGSIAEIFDKTGFFVEEISYCSGFLSEKISALLRQFQGRNFLFGWALTLPLRLIVPPIDRLLAKLMTYPPASICVEAYKPRG